MDPQVAWFILLNPLVAAAAILLLARRSPGTATFLSVMSSVLGLVAAFAAFASRGGHGPAQVLEVPWIDFGPIFRVPIGLMIDDLSKVMLLVVTGIGAAVHIYSTVYMENDDSKARYFGNLSLFMFSMLGIVLANNLVMMFIFWELVGVSSYLLIGHWFTRESAAAAANKAFITNRIGDFGFMLGILMVWVWAGTVVFPELAIFKTSANINQAKITTAMLLIFCGAVGKSAQFPLHVWLPDAMEGPTPVSALIHAATMVAAGVFLVARVYPLFSLGAVNGVTTSLTVVVWIGVVTALISALIALAQADIKRILAYSTVSQLGLMMVSLGVGGVAAGIMHLLAHGFFKALLFLGSGSVIHGCHEEQDIRQMGGLRGVMPITFLTYAIGMMALSGVPLFFSGAWTKEEILHATSLWSVSQLPHYLMMAGVVLTALYMTRQMIYVFFGNRRTASAHAHESSAVMTGPLLVLAFCTIALSVVLTPAWPWLHEYLSGETASVEFAHLIQPILFVSLVLVAAGIGLGVLLYRGVSRGDPMEERLPALFRFLENRMWLDELYDWTILALGRFAAGLSDALDRYFWDGLVRLFGGLGQLFGSLTKGFDEKGINAGVNDATGVARGLGRIMSGWQSGQIQRYLGAIALGMLTLLLFYAWLT